MALIVFSSRFVFHPSHGGGWRPEHAEVANRLYSTWLDEHPEPDEPARHVEWSVHDQSERDRLCALQAWAAIGQTGEHVAILADARSDAHEQARQWSSSRGRGQVLVYRWAAEDRDLRGLVFDVVD